MSDPKGNDIVRQVVELFRSAHDTLRRRRLFSVLFYTSGCVLLLLFLLSAIEYWLWMQPILRMGAVIATSAILGILIYRLTDSIQLEDFYPYYIRFAREKGHDSARYLVDMANDSESGQILPALHKAAIEQNMAKSDVNKLASDLDADVAGHPVSEHHSMSIMVLVAGIILSGTMGYFQTEAMGRVVQPWKSFEQPNPFVFLVAPGNDIAEQGSDLHLIVRFSDRSPDNLVLSIKTENESTFREIRMDQTGDQQFETKIRSLTTDMEYFFRMDRFNSELYRIEVQLLPRFTHVNIEVMPPDYTGLEPVYYEYPVRAVEAYPGSKLNILARSANPLAEAHLHSRTIGTIPMSIRADSGEHFEISANYPVTVNDSLAFRLIDVHGLRNRNPFHFGVELLTDQYPDVTIITPEENLSLLNPEIIDIQYEVSDDFGIDKLRLNYVVVRSYGTQRSQSGSVPLPTPRSNSSTGDYRFNLGHMQLLPMDLVRFWITATDNDTYDGGKSTDSRVIEIRVSSLSEQLLAQESTEREIAEQLEDFRELFDQNRRDLENLRQDILESRSDNWEQARQAEQIRDQREELSQQLEQVLDQFEELSSQLQSQESGLSEETRAMYDELRQLMNEIDDPDILRALEELQKGLMQMDQNQVRDALQQFEFSEERFRERLNRTVELFKALQTNAELDRIGRILEDLAQREESLIGSELPDLSEQLNIQNQIREDATRIMERLEQLPENSPQRMLRHLEQLKKDSGTSLENMDQLLSQDLQEMRKQIDGDSGSDDPKNQLTDPEPSDQQQQRRQQIRDEFLEIRDNVVNTRSMMNQQQIQVNKQALVSILQNLLLLSDEQEKIVQKVNETTQGSAAFIDLARSQRNVSGSFAQLADSLYKVSAEIPSFPNRVNTRRAEILKNLDQSVAHMAERDRSRASAESRFSLGGINEIGSMVADLLERLDESGGDGGGGGGMSAEQMLQQLQEMMGDQQQLNQQLQDLINDLQGERLMQDQVERLDQMARQQREIRRQLQELQQRGAFGAGDRLMSELQRLGEQMEDAINDLRGGVTDRIVVERQQNIFTRMLEAERAINERQLSEERAGQRPDEVERTSPTELTLETLREQIRRGLMDSGDTRYTEDYQRLIQRYFELLLELEQRRPSEINR